MAELLALRQLSAGYGEAIVISNIDLSVVEGESLAVLGRNGTGKTTLLNTIVGLTRHRGGTIMLGGRDLTPMRAEMRALAGIGWVPQERNIFKSLTVEENLTAVARPGPWTVARIYDMFPRLRERHSNLGNQLSGGEQQMLAIGRALVLNPRLMLLDEPTEGLAPIIIEELLAARVPSVQRVRFTNSGTEAALLAARIVARATGRRRLLMFDGAYHGSATLFLPGSPDVVRVPWNDLDAVAALLGRPGHDIAAVFAEPFLGAGGVRPAEPGFLAAVAGLAGDRDVLFVLDEVQGLRNGFGGEQGRLGLTPDLTLLGKIIGGGFPIGAVGGRADLLELTVASLTPGYVAHAGTFNGHLAAAVAGTMTLRHLDADAISRLNDAAAVLADRIAAGATAAGVPAEVTRAGSIMNVHLAVPEQLADLHLALLLNGVYATPRGMINLSTALGPGDLDDIAAAYETAFTQIRPGSVS